MKLKDRFLSKVRKTKGCWFWLGSTRNKKGGYGCLKINGKVFDAHRIAYSIFIGSIPKEKCVCHSCDNRKCVNPEHLWIGTKNDNNQDMISKGRYVPSDIVHGSASSYKRKTCLCVICRSPQARGRYLDSCRRSNINYAPTRKKMRLSV